MDISNKIKELRIKFNLSKKDFSAKIGMNESQFSRIESGNANITIERLLKISTVFKVRMSYFFDEETEPQDTNNDYKDKYIECLETNAKLLQQINTLEKNTPVPGPTPLPKLK